MSYMRILSCVFLMLCSLSSFALGLGEITVRSALNEPLDASVPLTGVADIEESELIVRLASQEAFTMAGISRDAVLLELQFTVNLEGTLPVIHITSERSIREPFLNFILDIQSPKAQLLKEFTVLLDPEPLSGK